MANYMPHLPFMFIKNVVNVTFLYNDPVEELLNQMAHCSCTTQPFVNLRCTFLQLWLKVQDPVSLPFKLLPTETLSVLNLSHRGQKFFKNSNNVSFYLDLFACPGEHSHR